MEVETKKYHIFKVDVRLNEYDIELLKTVKDKLGRVYAIRVLRFKIDNMSFPEAREYIDSL